MTEWDWISVKQRVPDDRRMVIVWLKRPFRPGIAVTTRYNRHASGTGYFEIANIPFLSEVTHWIDVVPPPRGES